MNLSGECHIAMDEDLWLEIENSLSQITETAAVLIAGIATDSGGVTLLGRRLMWVPDDAYVTRTATRLTIASQGYVPALGAAERDQSIAIFFHTHPGGDPSPSDLDEAVDAELRNVFAARTRSPWYASLIVGGTPSSPSFTGRLYDAESGQSVQVSKARIVGQRLRVLEAAVGEGPDPLPALDRQVRAFGRAGQQLLSRLRVGVVGAGGTGSAVCEQLIRMGVGQLVVLDDDVVDVTNLSRVHESETADLGRPKTELIVDRARAIGLGSNAVGHAIRLRTPNAARLISRCDVVFGCTDDHFGRGVLSRLAYWYLVPVIDMGVLIGSVEGQIEDLLLRVTIISPHYACLLCRGRISPQLIQAEAMTADERIWRAAEGYAPGLDEPAPSVVTYTTLVGSLAVSELLERLFGFGRGDRPGEVLVRVRDRSMHRNSVGGREGHYCVDRQLWGRGDREPFLGQLWP
jgi:molybdopterin/thiamine biosynthesis adenylyltransferase